MKKKIIKLVIAVSLVLATGCSNKETPKKDFQSVANTDTISTNLPKGAEIVDDPKDFKTVKLDQNFNVETDYRFSMQYDYTASKSDIYLVQLDGIYIMDKETKALSHLCNKPECQHNSSECNAHSESGVIQYYDGYLYCQGVEYVKEGEKVVADKQVIYKIAPDGSSKDKVCELATIYRADMVEANPYKEGIKYDVYWAIHRGYIYYVYDIGTADVKDESFYNNLSHYVFRMKIDGSKEREYIMPLSGITTEQISFYAYGSYMYFMDVDENDLGTLYRFNSESLEVEKMPLEDVIVQTYTMGENCLYYTKLWDTNLYCYDFSKGCISQVADFTALNEKFGKINGHIAIYKDNEYIWAMSLVDKEKCITNCIILKDNGEYISNFDICADGDYSVGIRFENDLVLLPANTAGCYWFDKEEILTGKIHPVKINGINTEMEHDFIVEE